MGNCGGSPSAAPAGRKPAKAAPAVKSTAAKTTSKPQGGQRAQSNSNLNQSQHLSPGSKKEARRRSDMAPAMQDLSSTIGRSKGLGGRLSVAGSEAPLSSRPSANLNQSFGRVSPTRDYDQDSSAGRRGSYHPPNQPHANIAVTRASDSDDDMDATWKYKNNIDGSNTSSANRDISPVGSEDPAMFRLNSYRSIGDQENFDFMPRQMSMDSSYYSPGAGMNSSFGSFNRHGSIASVNSYRDGSFSQSGRQFSSGSGGFRDKWGDLEKAYDSLDQGHYDTAFRRLKEIKRAGDVAEQMVAALGLSLLKGLGPGAWSQSHSFPDCEKDDVNTARKWLHERLQARRNRSVSAALALADISRALNYGDDEVIFRELSVKTKNPLALLRYAMNKSHQIKNAPPNLPLKQLELEKQHCMKILVELSRGEDRIAAKAGTYIWVSVYHGTDGLQQDTQKAIDLLAKAVKYELGKGDGAEFKLHMSRLQEKQFRNSSSFYNRPDLQYENLSTSNRDLRATANRVSTPRSLFEKRSHHHSPTDRFHSRRTSSMPGTPTNGPLPPRHPSVQNVTRRGTTGSNLKDPHQSYRSPPSARSQSSDVYSHRESNGGHSHRGMRRIDSVNSNTETIVEYQGENGIKVNSIRPQRHGARSRKVAVSDPNAEYGDDLDEDGNYDHDLSVANSDVASTARSVNTRKQNSGRNASSYRSLMKQQQERNGSSNEIQALYRTYNRKGSRGRPPSEAGTLH
eukprot:TRINITY_DN5754_c0_g1_i1.p1 TRINITY_DN5754_c0_g1~~TRINITY_DN5754_c0_g1_i1.p1  ORF type:complete len:738 (+),score=122.35 TRINITY_DN5754_c0_g1_i1:123-2336(+)